METKNDFTVAEKTLSLMSSVVLVLGIIGSIAVFLTSCISWEVSSYSGDINGVNGINWFGFPSLIYVLMATLIGWSLLSVIVEIAVNVRTKAASSSQTWQKEFALLVVLEKKKEARELLYKVIVESEEFKAVLSGGREEYHEGCIKNLNDTYAVYLKAIGEQSFNIDYSNELVNVFK